MAASILVPGASHTAWSCHNVVPLLEQEGHRARDRCPMAGRFAP